MAIRAGTFDPSGLAPAPTKAMTFRELAELYRDRHVVPKRLALAEDYAWSVKPFIDHWGDRAIADIKTADVQDFIADLQKPRVIGRRPGLRVLSARSRQPHARPAPPHAELGGGPRVHQPTPFRRGSETLIKKRREDNKRRRRIDESEEAALLAAAPAHVQAMIVAAIDTGMRQGEMLALRFSDVDLERDLITLRGETTKSRKTRIVPISTDRLRDVLAWLRLDADGDEKSDDTLFFSNEAGEPLAQVRDLLGHVSITTTERYDNQTLANLKIVAAKLERGHAFAHSARAKLQDSFKIEPSDAGQRAPRKVPAIEANELADLNLGDRLGRRDSPPERSKRRRRELRERPRSVRTSRTNETRRVE